MTTHGDVRRPGEAAWRWVLDQVRWDDGGPWIPESVPHDAGPPEDRDGMHSGIGGLAHVLAEVRESRAWTAEEQALADGIAARIRRGLATTEVYSYFDGLVSDIGVLSALERGRGRAGCRPAGRARHRRRLGAAVDDAPAASPRTPGSTT